MTKTVDNIELVARAGRVTADKATTMSIYGMMVKSRRLEERTADLVEAQEIKCPVHLYLGQEGVAAGACATLQRKDYVFGTHRSHAHYICKGAELRPLMAEFYGKDSGCAKGRGGSMHVIDTTRGMLGTTPIVAASIPMAAGAALASKMRKDGLVSVAFFGDGATEEGVFHETMNLAALWNLPMVFVCENNFYSSHLHLTGRRKSDNLVESGRPYDMPSARVDGNDSLSVYAHVQTAVDLARSGGGPTFLECRTYRWRGHVGPAWEWNLGIRKREEVEEWMERCPIRHLAKKILENKWATQPELDAIQSGFDREIEDAVEFARAGSLPTVDSMLRNVYVAG